MRTFKKIVLVPFLLPLSFLGLICEFLHKAIYVLVFTAENWINAKEIK